VRSTHVPAQFHEALDVALSPTRADVVAAKRQVLEALASGSAQRTVDLQELIREQEGIPAPVNRELLELPPDGDPSTLAGRDVPPLARVRVSRAVRRALAELQAEGVLLPVQNIDGDVAVDVRSGNTSGGYYAPVVVEKVAPAYALFAPASPADAGLLSADVYAAEIGHLLGKRGVRCIDEALRAHRRGLHLAAVNMLGAASEAAWYALGERLRGDTGQLAKALEDERTAVIRLVHDQLVQSKPGGATRETLEELRSHATYLRDLRNYGSHPRGRISGDLEHHFTEHATALTFMASHRYFMRLADIADHLPAPTVDEKVAAPS